ncbi:hypothetical protein EMIHUDRAFT_100036 [Emiliania huxleyi CCMP1516]|uniref:AB hydrolase-1 domain-containing protein n=2 Tax=Emiliania huxleyi TaxID=2903 RepID=A0A0D3JYJ1_EMIH1|nr:hypothetical protein EMIHUDRAFT_100036 [Emiliania huxleyi CCMP1516]EOD28576.1 hypothetical protein EMIHUDRAFT_100036 [Emiliania huxleyi CCMP1516]|eukprot:XP_005781005.1 hypothetical protein EMIHUDRAFT_100036 [Emiliania huxleyi CCMP1516]
MTKDASPTTQGDVDEDATQGDVLAAAGTAAQVEWVEAPGGRWQPWLALVQGKRCTRHLRVEVEGDCSSPIKVLAMHGWGCTLELWQALGFLSSLRGRACIAAFDTRGSGRSSCGRALWRINGLGEDALRVLTHLGWAPHETTLVGISQGGMVAQHAMALARERGLGSFAAAVLINTLPPEGAQTKASGYLRLVLEGLLQQADRNRSRRRTAHRALLTRNSRCSRYPRDSARPPEDTELVFSSPLYRARALAALVAAGWAGFFLYDAEQDARGCAEVAASEIAPTERDGGALMGEVSALLQDQRGPHVRGRLRGWLVNLFCTLDHHHLLSRQRREAILAAPAKRTLVMTGTADRVVPCANGARLAALYAAAGADVTLCPMPGLSHLPLSPLTAQPVEQFVLGGAEGGSSPLDLIRIEGENSSFEALRAAILDRDRAEHIE